jgi:hypothetical protein
MSNFCPQGILKMIIIFNIIHWAKASQDYLICFIAALYYLRKMESIRIEQSISWFSFQMEITMWVIVLNDGSTYTALEGSSVLWVPPAYEGDSMDRYVEDAVGVKGISLAITESSHALLTGDIYIPNLTEIEGG